MLYVQVKFICLFTDSLTTSFEDVEVILHRKCCLEFIGWNCNNKKKAENTTENLLDNTDADDSVDDNVNNYTRGDSIDANLESLIDNDDSIIVLISISDQVVLQEKKYKNGKTEQRKWLLHWKTYFELHGKLTWIVYS